MNNKQWVYFFILMVMLGIPNISQAFCGFYMAHTDSKLYNKSSKVVLARKDDTTVITMVNDYEGNPKDFAMLIPVPQVLARNQIRIANQEVVDLIDTFSAPRLVKYYDQPPCKNYSSENTEGLGATGIFDAPNNKLAGAYGVEVQATYNVGEYDIVILSAQQSTGLLKWLQENNYKVEASAAKVLESYIKQGMHFFVAKVNSIKQKQHQKSYLRPLQLRFKSKKFMLPIRLGMANSKGTQELYIFTLTAEGLVESTNYRTVKLPTNVDLPHAVESNFSSFYRSLFDYQFEQYDKRAIFMEYGGDINRCDPCIADALTEQQQRELGVFWLKPKKNKWSATAVYITRLHLRYDNAHFPDDLVFQETKNQQRTIFQLRYVIREPTNKGLDCDNGFAYVNHELPLRYETEAGNLAELTGEDINLVRKRLNLPQQPPGQKSFWNIVKQGLK